MKEFIYIVVWCIAITGNPQKYKIYDEFNRIEAIKDTVFVFEECYYHKEFIDSITAVDFYNRANNEKDIVRVDISRYDLSNDSLFLIFLRYKSFLNGHKPFINNIID